MKMFAKTIKSVNQK